MKYFFFNMYKYFKTLKCAKKAKLQNVKSFGPLAPGAMIV